MKHLLVDVGNTNVKYCLADGDSFVELSFEQAEKVLLEVEAVAVAAVAENKQANYLLSTASKQRIKIMYAEVSERSFGIECGYPKFNNLGIDRWLAVLAAEQSYPNEDIVVVDAGTAMTIDFLTSDKKHLGGWIVPGLDLMKSSIIERAPKVFGEEQVLQEQFGTDTPSAVFNGCLFTCIGSIQLAASFLTEQTKRPVKLLLTGGNSDQLSKSIKQQNYVDQFLVFKGLNRFLTDK